MNASRPPVLSRVAALIAPILRLEAEAIDMSAGMGTAPNWDSLCQLSIVAAVEQEFCIHIEPEDAVDLTTVGRICEFLERVQGRD